MGLFGKSDREESEELLWKNAKKTSFDIDEMVGLLKSDDRDARANAALALSEIASDSPEKVKPHVDDVADLLNDDYKWARRSAVLPLKNIAYEFPEEVKIYVSDIAEMLDTIPKATSKTLKEISKQYPGPVKAFKDKIAELLNHEDESVRRNAAWTIGNIAKQFPDSVIPYDDDLNDLAQNDPEEGVRNAAEYALHPENKRIEHENLEEPSGVSAEKDPEHLKDEVSRLLAEESSLDTREVEDMIAEGNLVKAQRALNELEKKYSEFKRIIEKLKELDQNKSDLAQRLSDGNIDRDTYNDAVQNINNEEYKLEEKLGDLRDEIIYEGDKLKPT